METSRVIWNSVIYSIEPFVSVNVNCFRSFLIIEIGEKCQCRFFCSYRLGICATSGRFGSFCFPVRFSHVRTNFTFANPPHISELLPCEVLIEICAINQTCICIIFSEFIANKNVKIFIKINQMIDQSKGMKNQWCNRTTAIQMINMNELQNLCVGCVREIYLLVHRNFKCVHIMDILSFPKQIFYLKNISIYY